MAEPRVTLVCSTCRRPLSETGGVCSRTETPKRKHGVETVEIVWRYCRAEKAAVPVNPQQPLF